MKLALVLLLAACSKRSAEAPVETKWLDLAPLPVSIQVPTYASYGTDKGVATVTARGCVLMVGAGSQGPMENQEAAIRITIPGAIFVRREPPLYLEYTIPNSDPPRHSFRYETSIGGVTYHCEPFTGRPDVTCEERACRSLRVAAR